MAKPKPRKIDGKKLPWIGYGTSSSHAKKRAKELRKKGAKNVRIIKKPKTKNKGRVWDIYGRK